MKYDPTPIWWPDEELVDEELEKAADLFRKSKPELVATHDCPSSVSEQILGKMLVGFRPEKLVETKTGKWLQIMFSMHKPRLWMFGHYHVNVTAIIKGTEFVCLDELSTKDV